MTANDPGPPCPACKAETQYTGQITQKGHPQDGRHLYHCPTKGCSLTGKGRTAVALEEKYEPGKGRYTCPHGTVWREKEAGPPINDYYYALQGERGPGCECLPPDEMGPEPKGKEVEKDERRGVSTTRTDDRSSQQDSQRTPRAGVRGWGRVRTGSGTGNVNQIWGPPAGGPAPAMTSPLRKRCAACTTRPAHPKMIIDATGTKVLVCEKHYRELGP